MATAPDILKDARYRQVGDIIVRVDPEGRQYIDEAKAAELRRQFPGNITSAGWWVSAIVNGRHTMVPLRWL